MTFTASVTKRHRKRRLTSGAVVVQTRFIVNFREPTTGRRKQLFFERHKDALAMRDALVASVATDSYAEVRTNLTVPHAIDHWLENRRSEVKKGTWDSYRAATRYIVGPLLAGTKMERYFFARTGKKPEHAHLIPMLGPTPIADLSTADIRNWHKTLIAEVGNHTANVAKKFLRAALALAAEDFNIRVPPMPSRLGRGRSKPKKQILTPAQIARLLEAAEADQKKGIYYAFPFLTGVRPSEQLALLWDDVDFAAGLIHIRRMQERDGSVSNTTKTGAGTRDVPIAPRLRAMLLAWRQVCPREEGAPWRVFPGIGFGVSAPHKKRGKALSYTNFRNSYWRPAFAALGLPYVTPHSARHAFISTLQSRGIEVGLVAKLAGHANATVTLTHYTQAVRGGQTAIQALDEAYSTIEHEPERGHPQVAQAPPALPPEGEPGPMPMPMPARPTSAPDDACTPDEEPQTQALPSQSAHDLTGSRLYSGPTISASPVADERDEDPRVS